MTKRTPLFCALVRACASAGAGVREVARQFGVDPKTVRRVLGAGVSPTRAVSRKQREMSRRRGAAARTASKTTQRGGRLFPAHASLRSIAAELKASGWAVSASTVRRDLTAAGMVARVRPLVPTRCVADNAKRLAFARVWAHRRVDAVVFSDETWLTTNEATGRGMWVRRGDGALPRERKAKWNTKAVQVWAAVGVGFKGPLVLFPPTMMEGEEPRPFRLNAHKYITRCLSRVAPFLVAKGRVLQQDGARCHASREVTEYLRRKGISLMAPWPAYSPDLNMIETLWPVLKRGVGERCPTTVQELEAAALQAWQAIPQTTIDRICRGFTAKVRRCVARGGAA